MLETLAPYIKATLTVLAIALSAYTPFAFLQCHREGRCIFTGRVRG